MHPPERHQRIASLRVAGRVAVLVSLCLSMLPGSALAHVLYVCSMDGDVHRACCCDRESPPDSVGPHSGDDADCGCCDVQIVAPAPHDVGLSGHANLPIPIASAVVQVLGLSVPAPSIRVPFEHPIARGPPPDSPPLWLRFRALLI